MTGIFDSARGIPVWFSIRFKTSRTGQTDRSQIKGALVRARICERGAAVLRCRGHVRTRLALTVIRAAISRPEVALHLSAKPGGESDTFNMLPEIDRTGVRPW